MTSSGTSSTTNKNKGRFGKIRDEEKTPEVKKLMPESLLNYRFRGTRLPYEELLIALEHIMDKLTTRSTSEVKNIDTSALMEIGMMARTFEEGHGKIHLNSQCKQCTREQGPKVDGPEERVPVGVYRNTSTVAKGGKKSESC